MKRETRGTASRRQGDDSVVHNLTRRKGKGGGEQDVETNRRFRAIKTTKIQVSLNSSHDNIELKFGERRNKRKGELSVVSGGRRSRTEITKISS